MRNEIIVLFYCPLIEDETLCTNKGCTDLKHLSDTVKSHDNSTTHINKLLHIKL